MQYSMALKQPTKQFLTNEFQFALEASKHLNECSKLGSYFLVVTLNKLFNKLKECEEFFNTVIENKDEKLQEELFYVNIFFFS